MKPAIEAFDRQELARILEQARSALSEEEYQRLKAAFDTLVYVTQLVENKNTTIARLRLILFGASTEKTAHVLKAVREAVKPDVLLSPPEDLDLVPAREGHGRNGAQAYAGATQIKVHHPSLNSGELCPECRRGKVYPSTTPGVLVRVVGQAPLAATVYEIEKLRCHLCLEVFTAPAPEGVGAEKYDAGAPKHDRAAEVRQWGPVPPPGRAAGKPGYPAAGVHPMGDRREDRRAGQAGLRGVVSFRQPRARSSTTTTPR